MFDHFHSHHTRQETNTRVQVTENRAPTDESVRLLKEMESAAQSKIHESIRIEDTIFNAVIHRYDNICNQTMDYAVIFNLNGRKIISKYSSDNYSCDIEKVKIGLRDAVAHDIAREIAPVFQRLYMKK